MPWATRESLLLSGVMETSLSQTRISHKSELPGMRTSANSCVWAQCQAVQELWLSPFSVSQLCVALSLLGNPSVLLLDEPSTSMDPNGQHCVW